MDITKPGRDTLVGLAPRAAALFPGRVTRVALFGGRPALGGDFPVAIVVRDPPTDPAERRALTWAFMDAA